MGELIPFDEAAARVSRSRGAGLSPADVGWLLAVCFWPTSLALFAGIAVMEAALGRGGRR